MTKNSPLQGPCSGSIRARQSHFIGRASQPARLLLTSPRFLREAAFGLFWNAGLLQIGLFSPAGLSCAASCRALFCWPFLLGALVWSLPYFLIRGAFLIRGPLARGLGMLASSDFRPSAGESLFRLVLGSSCRCYATHCSGRPPDGKGVAAHLTKCCADETYTYALFPIIYRCFSESPNSLIVLGHSARPKTRFSVDSVS